MIYTVFFIYLVISFFLFSSPSYFNFPLKCAPSSSPWRQARSTWELRL